MDPIASYESKAERLITPRQFAHRLLRHGAVSAVVIAASLALGVCGYHGIERLPWLDALLEASMILSGMGPIHAPASAAGKVFASLYALFSGVVFIGITGLMLAPVVHRVLHKFHLDEGDDRG